MPRARRESKSRDENFQLTMMKANQDDEMGEEEERGRVGTDGVIRTWLLGSDVRAQLPLGVGARNQGRGNANLFSRDASPSPPHATVWCCRLHVCCILLRTAICMTMIYCFTALPGRLSQYRLVQFYALGRVTHGMASTPQLWLVQLQRQQRPFICSLICLFALIAYTPLRVE